jgi:hypothetical protein
MIGSSSISISIAAEPGWGIRERQTARKLSYMRAFVHIL